MSESNVDHEIEAFLATCKTASLATIDQHGKPFAANIQYVNDEHWRLYWVSSMSSAPSANIEHKRDVAITIYAHQDNPENIHGLQMRGPAVMLGNEHLGDIFDRYAAKYPFVTGPPYDKAMKLQLFYRFTPTWLRWLDNRKGFGWKVEKTKDSDLA